MDTTAAAPVPPLPSGFRPEHPNTPTDPVPATPPAILHDPDLLTTVANAMESGGFAGDPAPAQIAYIAFTSRVRQRPLCVAFVAPSATGKNACVDAALQLIPPTAYRKISAGSERVLIYGDRNLSHKTVVYGEADSIPDDGAAASAFRSLISDGHLRYEVVQKREDGRFATEIIDITGPTGLVTTSTRSLAYQLGTRLLEITLSDSEDQTRQVLIAQAKGRSGGTLPVTDLQPFLDAQLWLEQHGERRVVIPFAVTLARMVPAGHVRMRRDFPQFLTTIEALALLYQLQRRRTAAGEVEASLEDYAQARALLAPVFEAVEAEGLTPAVRELVEAFQPKETLGVTAIAKRLNRSKSTISERVTRAVAGGWLVNEELVSGRPARLSLGEPLPDALTSLPTVEELRAALVGSSGRSPLMRA